MYEFYDPQTSIYVQQENERKEIKRISIAAALSVIAYVLVQNILSIIIYLSPLGEIYQNDLTMQSVVTIFLSVLGILVPFGISGYFIGNKSNRPAVSFDRPVSIPLMISAACLGFFVCLAGNYVTSIFVSMMDSGGVTLTAPEYSPPADISGRIIYAVSIAVVPALVEEFAVRGVILQSLRKYGDKFAILASALIFAVMHGNLIQAPFALIAGIGIGYAVCITNSLWTGVLIHFFNNLYSVVIEFMSADIQDVQTLNTVYVIITAALYGITILGSVVFVILKRRRKLMPSFTALTEKSKIRAFIFTVPMIVTLLMMISITSNYVSFG